MMHTRDLREVAPSQLGALLASVALLIVLEVQASASLRFAVALVFVVLGPGTAIIGLIPPRLGVTFHPGVVVPLGLAVTVLVAEGTMYLGAFHPHPHLLVFAVIVLVVVVIGIALSLRRNRVPASPDVTTTRRTDDTPAGHEDTATSMEFPDALGND
jgi:hypothetical protein